MPTLPKEYRDEIVRRKQELLDFVNFLKENEMSNDAIRTAEERYIVLYELLKKFDEMDTQAE